MNVPKPICERIGAKIKFARKSLGLTFKALAEQTDLSPSYIWEIEAGHSEPGAGVIIRLCLALRLSADELLGLNEKEP